MAFQPPPYQLFNVRPFSAESSMDAFVSVLWRMPFPRQFIGPDLCLDQIFARMSHQPELAALQLCPYYFDQVTYSLPTKEHVRHMESKNLTLHWFDSWADLQQEMRRAAEKEKRQLQRAKPGPRFSTGVHLSRLYQLHNQNTGRSLSTRQYVNLMYGSRL